jgi:hypothetical protein
MPRTEHSNECVSKKETCRYHPPPVNSTKFTLTQEERHHLCSSDAATNVVFYDSDDEPPTEAYSEHLSWRSDPSVTHSDWTIQIISSSASSAAATTASTANTTTTLKFDGPYSDNHTRNTSNSVLYHVHKNILSVGPRRSEYFVRLFEKLARFAECQSKRSTIELDELSSKAFPALLDFMYGGSSRPHQQEPSLQLDTHTATALHSLGSYFEMRLLKWRVRQFLIKDLSIETCAIYLEHACLLHDEKVKAAVGGYCAQHIQKLTKESPILQIWDPIFWMAVMMLLPRNDSRHASVLIAQFCRIHLERLDAETFLDLTNSKLLPELKTLVCPTLIRLENLVVGSRRRPRRDPVASTLSTSSSSSHSSSVSSGTSITSLQDRALTSISAARLRHPLSERPLALYTAQGPEFMAELLRRSLKELQSAYWKKKLEPEGYSL